jgi:hypothetical protein
MLYCFLSIYVYIYIYIYIFIYIYIYIYIYIFQVYRKPPTISPGLIYFRSDFWWAYKRWGLTYGWAYTWTTFCVSNKQVRHKQVCYKQGNKRVLNSDYLAYINSGDLYLGGLYSGGLILEGLILGMRWALVHVVGIYKGELIFVGRGL